MFRTTINSFLTRTTAALALSALATSALAAPIGYGVDGDDSPGSGFYSIDFATGAGTLIGNVGFNDVEAMHFYGSTLYAIDDSDNALITIDTATGVGTLVGDLGVTISNPGLAISASGQAIAGDGSGNDLWTIDLGTGAATLVNDGGLPVDFDALTFLGDTLYGFSTDNDSLYTIDTTSYAATLVGALTQDILSPEAALTTDGTWLYGADDDGDYLRINPLTAASTLITRDGEDVEGLAMRTAAVPEPGTLGVLGLGMIALMLKRKRGNV